MKYVIEVKQKPFGGIYVSEMDLGKPIGLTLTVDKALKFDSREEAEELMLQFVRSHKYYEKVEIKSFNDTIVEVEE